MSKNKKYNTRTLLKRRFFAVAAATIGLSLLPVILFLITMLAYQTDPTEQISASERLMPQACDVVVSDYIADGGSAMIVDNALNVTQLGGKPIWDKAAFSEKEWADFLAAIDSMSGYQYDIAYHSGSDGYWLIMRKPVSVVVIFSIYFNPEAENFTKDSSF